MKRHFAQISILVLLAGVLATGAALAQTTLAQTSHRADPIALKNWKVPSIETMVRTLGESPDTHFVNPGAFVFQSTVPCRIVDTRGAVGQYGGPIFSAGQTRTYSIVQVIFGTCGSSFPSNIAAVSLNITVAQTAGTGFVTGYATGGTLPGVANITFVGPNVILSNAAIVPTDAGALSQINIFASQTTHVIIDMNGIFIRNLSETGDQLAITTSRGNAAAVLGVNDSSTNGSHGVGGFESGSGIVHGVQGQISAAANTGSSGVHGIGANTGLATYGVLGSANTTAIDSAGVRGIAGDGPPPGSVGCCFQAGVRGDSNDDYGVVGISQFIATFGILVNGAGTQTARGLIGTSLHAGPWGVYAEGNIGATGAKPFVEIHPTDPSKLIRYVALEGPEAGTYFRGTDQTSGGTAVIQVPESFRLVTDTEGLTVQLTSVGAPATMYVVSQDLNQIVVHSSRDVRFHYMVNGVRATFKDWQVIVGDSGYMPDGPDYRLPAFFSPEQQRRLIANGTYNPDGTVNMETARRLGWVKMWEARTRTRSQQ